VAFREYHSSVIFRWRGAGQPLWDTFTTTVQLAARSRRATGGRWLTDVKANMRRSTKSKTLRSPKDLIGVTTRPASEGEGLKFEQIGSNQARIAFLRDWADTAIRNNGKDPAQYQKIIGESAFADRAYWAACMLKRLDDIEGDLAFVEHCSDAVSVRRIALNAIHHALVLASEFHMLTVADNEAAIVTGTATSRGLASKRAVVNADRHAKRSRVWKRWKVEAKKIWERHPALSRQAVASRVKKNLGLGEAVRTIAKRLKKPGKAC
jgi:hypothetical protein